MMPAQIETCAYCGRRTLCTKLEPGWLCLAHYVAPKHRDELIDYQAAHKGEPEPRPFWIWKEEQA